MTLQTTVTSSRLWAAVTALRAVVPILLVDVVVVGDVVVVEGVEDAVRVEVVVGVVAAGAVADEVGPYQSLGP